VRFERVRSGLAETSHDVAAVALDAHGHELFTAGDVARPIFHRSAIKPFQALAARRFGLDLPPEHLAITCASHGGYPVHVAIVEDILRRRGLDSGSLRTPPDWPLAPGARVAAIAAGYRAPRPVFHNCSGKHAGWLAACAVAGLDPSTYTDADHPIQRSALAIVADMCGIDPTPVGIDGCGAPTLRGHVRSLARGFSALTTDPDMVPIAEAMTAYGALVADNVRGDGRFGLNWGGPSKAGAEGIFAASLHGIAIVAKSWDGSSDVAVAAVIEVADRIGLLPRGTAAWLDDVRHPPVRGGGEVVGRLELAGVG
jgi:L-asparaginase II